MSFIGDVFSGDKGAGFQAQGASIINPTDLGQTNNAYNTSQDAIRRQQEFLSAIQTQNGLGNQSNVFNQQQALAGQMQGVADGTGPNPALAQLNQATQANVQNQAALMAGQRGAASNVGMMARLAAQQGANTQQQAVGQGATMAAQQQIAGQQALAAQQANMAQLASQQVGQQAQAVSGLNSAAQNQQQMLLNSIQGVNAASVSSQNAVNSANAGVAGINAGNQGKMVSGGISSLGSAVGLSHGGPVGGNAPVRGDNPVNDTVPAMLSPGEVVIPRSIMNSHDPSEAAKAFIQALISKNHIGKGYADGGVVSNQAPPTPAQPTIVINTGQPQSQAPDSAVPPPANSMAAQNNAAYLAKQPEAMAPTPEAAPAVATGPAPASLAPMPETEGLQAKGPSSQPLPPQDPYGIAAGQEAYMRGLSQQKAGIVGEAQALGAQGKAEAKILDEGQAKLQNAQNNYETNLKAIDEERAQLQQKFADKTVDPQQYLNQMSGGHKVRTAIGLILGGIGSNGGENPVLKQLNKMIDSNVAAQLTEIDKGKNLLALNQQKYGNLNTATEMLKSNLKDAVKFQLEKAVAEAQDPLAKARGQKALGEWDKDSSEHIRQNAMQRTLMGASGGGNDMDQRLQALRYLNPQMAKEQESRYVPATKEMASIPISDDVRKEMSSRQVLQDEVAKLRDFAKNNEGSLDPSVIQRGKTMASQVQDAYRRANGQGVFKESEAHFVKGIVEEDPTKFFNSFRVDPKLRALEEGNLAELNGVRSRVGLKPVDQSAKLNPEQQKFFEWAKANPGNPKAKLVMQKLGMN